MIGADAVFDLAMVGLLLILAGAALHAPRLYLSVVVFIAFGLVLALIWARMGAADLALAEAALGAGLTGALLLGVLSRSPLAADTTPSERRRRSFWRRYSAAGIGGVLAVLAFVLLLWPVLAALSSGLPVLPAQIRESLPESGVEHPVTAVLLNYRAWDTLLELVVLMLALFGVRQLPMARQPTPAPWPLLLAWARFLAPLTVVVGGYTLWRGAYAPGGAFQAGALLAAGAVILRLCGLLPPVSSARLWVRALMVAGLAMFLVMGGISLMWGGGWLAYPEAWAGAMILAIEVAATLSIATILTLLVVGDDKELHS